MERHDAMTRRPSLMAGGEEPTGAPRPRERLLPSIDTPEAAARPRRPRRRPWPWLLAGLLALFAVALLVTWRTAPVAGDTPPPAPAPDRGATDHQRGAAMIIDDTAPSTRVGHSRVPVERPGVADQAGEAEIGATATPASPFAALAPARGTPNPFGGTRSPAPAEPPAHPAPDRSEGASPALLATLLGHIHAEPGPATPMDRLVEQLAGGEATARASAGAARAQFRSYQIQMNLRDCPPANTAEGVACRARICEVYAGRDPACPAG